MYLSEQEKKESLKKRLLNKLYEEYRSKTPLKIISYDEYKAIQKLTSFTCPLGREIGFCDGKNCPSRPEDIYLDYWDECIQVRTASHIIDKVLQGKIIIKNENNGWEIPVE